LCDRTPTSDAWRFADTGVTRAISIMAYCELNLSCHVDMHTHAGSWQNPLTLTFDLLTSASKYTEWGNSTP